MNSPTPMFWLLTAAYVVANIPFKLAALLSRWVAREMADPLKISVQVNIEGVSNLTVQKVVRAAAKELPRSFIGGGVVETKSFRPIRRSSKVEL